MKRLSILIIGLSLLSINLNAKELKVYACGVTRVAFMNELNKAFEDKFKIKVKMNEKGGDLFVLNGVAKGDADIGSGCREILKDDEKEKDLWSTQVAWGALGFIVNPKNKIDNISKENVKKILTGKITNFKEIGGEDKPIHLIIRESKKSGVGLSARELLFNDINKDFTDKAKKVKNSDFIVEEVRKDENAFAIDNVISSNKHKNIKLLKVDGIEPTKKNILADKYKLRQALYFYIKGKPKDDIDKYVDFALSDEGQKVISDTGTPNLEEATGQGDEENFILQNLQFDIKSK